jgi:hypothetical protein
MSSFHHFFPLDLKLADIAARSCSWSYSALIPDNYSKDAEVQHVMYIQQLGYESIGLWKPKISNTPIRNSFDFPFVFSNVKVKT